MNVPGFLARQFYVAGSLQDTPDGFSLGARNPMGEGHITGIGRLAVDGRPIDPAAVTALRDGDPTVFQAGEVSRERPITVHKGDTVTLRVVGHHLEPGEHRLEVELIERDLGALRLAISDRVRGG